MAVFRAVLDNPLRPDDTDLIFFGEPGRDGIRRPYEFRPAWHRILKETGIRGFHFHDLRHEAVSRLVEALSTTTQQRVLGLLFGEPDRSFYTSELIDRIGASPGAVQRELKGLVESNPVTVKRIGNQKHYQANPNSPVFEELCSITRKIHVLQ